MKYYFTAILFTCGMSVFAQNTKTVSVKPSPLAGYSEEWNKAVYTRCNTAENMTYMSSTEKNVIYVLNLLRANPKLFVQTVLLKYPERSDNDNLLNDSYYFKSLVSTMQSMKPLPLLLPDIDCYFSALCHANQSGITGYVGHEREIASCLKKRHFNGECCDYGHNDAVDIIMSLVIDDGVESLGHRNICLGKYEKIAVSIQPHKTWRYNAVLDFHF